MLHHLSSSIPIAITFLCLFLANPFPVHSSEYKRSKWDIRDYDEFVNYCMVKHLFPASFHSQEDLNALGELCGPDRSCWLGFDDRFEQNIFDFLDQSEFDLPPPWAPGQPIGAAPGEARCGFIDKENRMDADENILISLRTCEQDWSLGDTFALCGDGIDEEEVCPQFCPTVSFDGCNHCWCGRDADNPPCEDNVCHGDNEYIHRRCLWVDRVEGGCPMGCRIVDDGCRKCLCRPGFRLCQSESACSAEEMLKADANICMVADADFDSLMTTPEGMAKVFGSFSEWEFESESDWMGKAIDRGYLTDFERENKFEDEMDANIVEAILNARNAKAKAKEKGEIAEWVYVFAFLMLAGVMGLGIAWKVMAKNGLADRFCSVVVADEYSPLLVNDKAVSTGI